MSKKTSQACPKGIIGPARDQAKKMIAEAAKLLKPHEGRFPQCEAQLDSARTLFDNAGKAGRDPKAQRDAYIRATFQAGQARVCPIIKTIAEEGEKIAPPSKRKKKRGES